MTSEVPVMSKRERTRARLVEAAAEVFAEKGFHAATLDDVARVAGLTKGAIYGNFRSKDDLLLATFRLPAQGVKPAFEAGASLERQLRLLGESVVAFAPLADRRRVRVSDFQLYVATHPEMQGPVTAHTEAIVARIVDAWGPFFDEGDLGMPMRTFVILADALIDGLLIQRIMTPTVVTDDIILAAFSALGGRAVG
jgi:AcrR family transcriptional regulator